MSFFSMVISQNSLSNMTTNCANCDYSAINGSKVIHNVEGVKINFAQLFYRDVPIHRYRYRHRLISVSFFHIGIGLMKIEPI